jgi:hypothetical protein
MFLKVYSDDSSVGDMPVSLLAGWMAEDHVWADLEQEWTGALGMSPRLRYFKESEARALAGEFAGWSAESRLERMNLLARIIGDYKPLGIASAIRTEFYKEVFGGNPDKILRHPYFFMFFDIVTRMSSYLAQQGFTGKVQFIFDEQKHQQDYVAASWTRLLEVAPAGIRPILTEYPIFRSDQSAVGLQAADFSAGFLRRQLIDSFNEQETPDPPWTAKMSEIGILGKLWERNEMVELAKARPDFGRFMQIRGY